MKKVCVVLLVTLLALSALTGCSTAVTSGSSEGAEAIYKEGEMVTIKKDGRDLYTLTINSIGISDHRNEFWDKTPNQVAVINYTYENIANEQEGTC